MTLTATEINERLKQFQDDLNKDPNSGWVKKNDDGSLYLPISKTQLLLDDIFLGLWNFEMKRETFGRKWARGSGIITVTHPVTGNPITRNGDAAIILTGNLRIDSPRLEAMVLLSGAKKLGRVFGRDLNRDKDDAPLPVAKIEKPDMTTEEQRMKILIEECNDVAELETYRLIVPKPLKKLFETKLKQLNNQP